MMFTEYQFNEAFKKARDEISATRTAHKYAEAVSEAMAHILRCERPFRHDYIAESHHNGDEYDTHDIVWRRIKPEAGARESYTLIELPEYEEAMRRLSLEPERAPIIDPQRE